MRLVQTPFLICNTIKRYYRCLLRQVVREFLFRKFLAMCIMHVTLYLILYLKRIFTSTFSSFYCGIVKLIHLQLRKQKRGIYRLNVNNGMTQQLFLQFREDREIVEEAPEKDYSLDLFGNLDSGVQLEQTIPSVYFFYLVSISCLFGMCTSKILIS